jgi:hypothetical protein
MALVRARLRAYWCRWPGQDNSGTEGAGHRSSGVRSPRHGVANGLRRVADLIDRTSAGGSSGYEPGAHRENQPLSVRAGRSRSTPKKKRRPTVLPGTSRVNHRFADAVRARSAALRSSLLTRWFTSRGMVMDLSCSKYSGSRRRRREGKKRNSIRSSKDRRLEGRETRIVKNPLSLTVRSTQTV